MLSCNNWFYCLSEIVSLLANLATIGGVISIFLLLHSVIKNKPSNKSIQALLRYRKTYNNSDKVTLYLDIINFTDKEFSIYAFEILLDNIRYSFCHTINDKINGETIGCHSEEIKNKNILPHQSITLYGFIAIDNNFSIPNKASLLLRTTTGDFVYKIKPSTFANSVK